MVEKDIKTLLENEKLSKKLTKIYVKRFKLCIKSYRKNNYRIL